jgi:hypothetical protein
MATGQLVLGNGVKELQTQDDSVSMFERWAKDPAIDVDKFERFMVMWERERARCAEAEFDTAMNTAQEEMEPVRKDAHNKQTNSRYASFEALDEAVRPIYTRHGFALSFDTGDAPHAEEVRMLCYASHKGGHKRTYKIDLPADGKGAKGGDVMTRTHATVSATSYGQRVLLRMIFNIAVGGDDDGNRASGKVQQPEAPSKFDEWITDMGAVADQGFPEFAKAYKASKQEFKTYAETYHRDALAAMKKKAVKVKAS